MTDAADICNRALGQIGYVPFIADMYEGSRASRLALRIYGHTRDDLLRSKDWPFARRTAGPLTVLKRAVIPPPLVLGVNNWTNAQPPPPWEWEYAYPADCLYLRYIRLPPFQTTKGDANVEPTPNLWVIVNDTPIGSTIPQKVILANIPFAIAHYTGRITDPDTWEPMFTQALIDQLARRFTLGLASPQMAVEMEKLETIEGQTTATMADEKRG